ncbi:hypothetical protein [Acetobacter indonesiensis]|uniref:hypothetical protein n=1 Tax=Acetobacter indonesiensis TaxID=104101 RepID=UPI0021006097|nr:hypothetical protein [Acetobacter indonesiensis]
MSHHVLHGAKNEAIRVLAGSDWLMRDHMQEAKRERLTYGLRHIAFNPAQAMSDAQLAEFAGHLCQELKADPSHMTLIIHQKDGLTHGHLILPEWQQDRVLESRFSWMRLEKVARLEELRLGHALVPGRHDKTIAKALHKQGYHHEAEQVESLIPPSDNLKPRAAYTAQARRMAERQGVDLATRKTLVATLWSHSDGLKSFRAALKEHGLTMREGDRKDTRPGAHIIEDENGTLIGSFTRLTKVRMADFRKLLSEENTSRQKPAVIRRPKRNKFQQDLYRKRVADVDRPARSPQPVPHTGPIIRTVEEARLRRLLLNALQDRQAILDQQAPAMKQPLADKDVILAQWRKNLQPYEKQLRKAYDRYCSAKKVSEEARKSVWQRLSGKHRRLQKQFDQTALDFLEVLRFAIQGLLFVVGLRLRPPDPVRPVVTERNRPRLERIKTKYDAEFAALANPQEREDWLNKEFEAQNRARQRLIYEWNEKHRPAKEQARRDMSLFRSLLDSKPFSAERAEFTKLASQMPLEDGLLRALQKPIQSRTNQHLGIQFLYQQCRLRRRKVRYQLLGKTARQSATHNANNIYNGFS